MLNWLVQYVIFVARHVVNIGLAKCSPHLSSIHYPLFVL